MYHSSLEKRQKPIDAAAFKDVPDLVFNQYAVDERPDRDSLILWDKHIPYTPLEIYNLFTGGYELDGILLNVNLFENGRMEFQINHARDEAFISYLTFMDKTVRDIHSSKVQVAPESQGLGIGRTSMRNWIELAAALDFPAFTFEAGLDNGGYTWARMGAHLDRNEERTPFYREDEQNLKCRLLARLEAARPFISKADYSDARALCHLRNPDDLVRLTYMTNVIVSQEVMDEAMTAIPRFYTRGMGDSHNIQIRIKEECKNLRSIFTNASVPKEYVTLPCYLQAKTAWSAVVDFSNDAQMERVGDYVYGWQTLEPVREPAMA